MSSPVGKKTGRSAERQQCKASVLTFPPPLLAHSLAVAPPASGAHPSAHQVPWHLQRDTSLPVPATHPSAYQETWHFHPAMTPPAPGTPSSTQPAKLETVVAAALNTHPACRPSAPPKALPVEPDPVEARAPAPVAARVPPAPRPAPPSARAPAPAPTSAPASGRAPAPAPATGAYPADPLARYDPFSWPMAPPTGPQPLHWFVDRPTARRPDLADWSEVARSADSLARKLLGEVPPEPDMKTVPPLPPYEPLDGDDPKKWLCIGQRVIPSTACLDLNQYWPVKNGLARGNPFTQSSADNSIPIDLRKTNIISSATITRAACLQDPIQLSLKLFLKRNMFELIASATNAFARGRGASELLLAEWRDTDWKEASRFFFANLLIASITHTRETISDEQLLRNPLLARLVGPRRYLQLTRAFRLKRDDQTPDEFVDCAVRDLTWSFAILLGSTPWVFSLQTYRLNFECHQSNDCECASRAGFTRCPPGNAVMLLTLLKVGQYVLRVAFHKTPGDTQMSGNLPTASPSLLKRLLLEQPLRSRFFIAASGATLQMAKFFHSRGAYFIGSVGPQAYRLVNPQQDNIPIPEQPHTGLYLEPFPGIREVILLRNYSADPDRAVWLGYPVPRGHLSQTHLICNIGGGDQMRINKKGPTGKEEFAPHALHMLQYHLLDNERLRGNGVLPTSEARPKVPFRCPSVWHQRVVMHLLFVGFMNGWHAHAYAARRSLSNVYASMDILHHLFGFMYDWVICSHNLRAEPRLTADGGRTAAGSQTLLPSEMREGLRRARLPAAVEKLLAMKRSAMTAYPSGGLKPHTESSKPPKESLTPKTESLNPPKEGLTPQTEGSKLPTVGARPHTGGSKLPTGASKPSMKGSRLSTWADRTVRWTNDRINEWKDIVWARPQAKSVSEWHGSTSGFEPCPMSLANYHKNTLPLSKMWSAIFMTPGVSFSGRVPLAADCAIGPRVWMKGKLNRLPPEAKVFYWGSVKMAPTRTARGDGATDNSPWRAPSGSSRRRSF